MLVCLEKEEKMNDPLKAGGSNNMKIRYEGWGGEDMQTGKLQEISNIKGLCFLSVMILNLYLSQSVVVVRIDVLWR